jgi:WD40 repeat protein
MGRPDSELYRGGRLSRTLDWAASTGATLTSVELDFLEAARAQAEVEERGAVERARLQATMIRRLRLVLSGAVVLLVLALAAGGVAAVQSKRASDNAARAEQAAVSADARRVGARAQLTDDIDLSLLLATAGTRLEDSPETRVNLLTALSKQPHLVRSGPPGGGYLEGLSVSPDGRWIAASDEANRMHLYDASTNRLLRSYDAGRPREDGQAWMMGAFSPDGRRLAVVLESVESIEPVRLLDPRRMRPATALARPGAEPAVGFDVHFSADGRYLAAGLVTVPQQGPAVVAAKSYVAVWDLRSPSRSPVRVPTGAASQGVALSPDGQTLYTSWPLTAYRVATGKRIWRRGEIRSFLALDVNAAGTLLVLAQDDTRGNALLVDAATGDTVATLRGHRDGVSPDIRFSPDGTLVGSSSRDGTLIVWETATGRPLERWDTFDPWGVGFSPDDELVHGGGGDSMLRTWDLSMHQTYLLRTTQMSDVARIAHADVSPDGQRVAYRWRDDTGTGWISFVDAMTGVATRPTRLPARASEWPDGAWHPGGETYAAHCEECTESGTVTVLDSATGKAVGTWDTGGDIDSLGYVDDGRSILVGHREGPTHIIDARSLRPHGDSFGVPASCCATPIGRGATAMVYESSGDGASAHWRVLDVGTGEVSSDGKLSLTPFASVSSPDGSTVAVAGDTGEIVSIDVSTGAERRRSTGRGAEIWWLNYSDDGELLVSGANDGGVSLWDAGTLALLGSVYPPHGGRPAPAAANFIGHTHDVAIASYDGAIYRWETDLDRAIAFACQMAGRDLTEAEWAQFLPAQPYRSVCPDQVSQGR